MLARILSVMLATAVMVAVAILVTPDAPANRMPVGDIPGWKQTGAQDFNLLAERGHVGDVYGPDMRGYHDFGVALQDPRAAIKCKGEA